LETELKSEVAFRAACNPNRVFQQGHRIWLLRRLAVLCTPLEV